MLFLASVIGLGSIGGVAAMVGANVVSSLVGGLPDPTDLSTLEFAQPTIVYDRTGTTLLARFECENRESVSFDDLPRHVVNATIAAEDRTFWTNDGIDYQAVARAALANLEAGTIVQGASTITQQVIKYTGSIQEAGEGQRLDPQATAAPEVTLDPDEEATTTEEEQAEEGHGVGNVGVDTVRASSVPARTSLAVGKRRGTGVRTRAPITDDQLWCALERHCERRRLTRCRAEDQ